MTDRRPEATIAAAAIGILALLLALSTCTPANARPDCDTKPDAPRCQDGTTTTTITTSTTPAGTACISIISGSNGDRYWNEAVEHHGLPSATIGLGGGDTHRWGTPDARGHDLYWSIYADHEPDDCDVQTWWLALSRGSTSPGADAAAEADTIVERFLAESPGGALWAVPMQPYDPDGCTADNVPASEDLIAYAAATYPDVVRLWPGADYGWPTVIEHTTDGCHPGGDTLTAGAAAIATWAATLEP